MVLGFGLRSRPVPRGDCPSIVVDDQILCKNQQLTYHEAVNLFFRNLQVQAQLRRSLHQVRTYAKCV